MDNRSPRSRPRIVGVMVLVVVLGLLGRRLPGLIGDVTGGLLYAVLLYLLFALILPLARPFALIAAAAVTGLSIELFQLTGVPARIGSGFPPARLVLGTTFVPLDLAIAVAGAAIAPLTEFLTRLPREDEEGSLPSEAPAT